MRTRVLILLPFLLLRGPVGAAPLQDTPEEQLAAASALYDAKKYPEAARKLESFLALNPNHVKVPPAALALGRCRAEQKQWATAVLAYEKALRSKEDSILIPARLGIGEAALNLGQLEKAAVALEPATKLDLKPEQAAIAWYWLAQAHFGLQHFDRAEDAYGRAIRLNPRPEIADNAWLGFGLCAQRLGRPDDARERLRQMVTRFPKSEDRPQALLVLAQIDFQGKRYGEARAGFERLIDDAGRTPPEIQRAAEDGLIQTLLESGAYGTAIPRLESALQKLPAGDTRRPRILLNLGHCQFRQKNASAALAAYREAAQSSDAATAAESMYWAANALLALNKPGDAATQFASIPAKYPKSEFAAKAQLKAGDAYRAASQDDAAIGAYRAVTERFAQSPQAADARKALAEIAEYSTDPAQLAAALKNAPAAERMKGAIRLARVYLQQKKYAEASSALADVAKPGAEPEAHYLLGLAYEGLDKNAQAAASLAEASRATDAPWVADAQTRLAWLYLELKQPANAEKAAQGAVGRNPEPRLAQQARLALVQAELDLQKWEAALDGCRTLLANNPDRETLAAVLFAQAWVNEKRGKEDEAQPLWERLASEYATSQYAVEALIRLGDARMKAEKYDEARVKYAAVTSGFPNHPRIAEARFKLGSVLYNMNKPAEAAAEFEAASALKNAGDYGPESLYWAGVALDKAGKKDEAIDRLTRFVAQNPNHNRTANAKVRLAALRAVK